MSPLEPREPTTISLRNMIEYLKEEINKVLEESYKNKETQ